MIDVAHRPLSYHLMNKWEVYFTSKYNMILILFKVNAKISDYGISRFSTPDGLMAQEGTPAYRAPEVIRGETYSFQVSQHLDYLG